MGQQPRIPRRLRQCQGQRRSAQARSTLRPRSPRLHSQHHRVSSSDRISRQREPTHISPRCEAGCRRLQFMPFHRDPQASPRRPQPLEETTARTTPGVAMVTVSAVMHHDAAARRHHSRPCDHRPPSDRRSSSPRPPPGPPALPPAPAGHRDALCLGCRARMTLSFALRQRSPDGAPDRAMRVRGRRHGRG